MRHAHLGWGKLPPHHPEKILFFTNYYVFKICLKNSLSWAWKPLKLGKFGERYSQRISRKYEVMKTDICGPEDFFKGLVKLPLCYWLNCSVWGGVKGAHIKYLLFQNLLTSHDQCQIILGTREIGINSLWSFIKLKWIVRLSVVSHDMYLKCT